MSHLARIVAVQQALGDAGVECPVTQRSVVAHQFGKAIVGYAFTIGGYGPLGLTEKCNQIVSDQLNRWNNVSPINGNLIREMVKQFLIQHHVEGQKGGNFTPFPCVLPEACKDNPEVNSALYGLFDKLLQELCEGEE